MSIPGYDYPASYDDEDRDECNEPDPDRFWDDREQVNASRKKNIKLIKIEWFEIDDFGFCGADGECVGKEHSTNSGWSYIFRNFPTLKKHPFGGGGESP